MDLIRIKTSKDLIGFIIWHHFSFQKLSFRHPKLLQLRRCLPPRRWYAKMAWWVPRRVIGEKGRVLTNTSKTPSPPTPLSLRSRGTLTSSLTLHQTRLTSLVHSLSLVKDGINAPLHFGWHWSSSWACCRGPTLSGGKTGRDDVERRLPFHSISLLNDPPPREGL